jgi:hypothetical protein
MRMRAAIAILLAGGVGCPGWAGCASSTAPDPGLEGLAIDSVAPRTVIPGTKLIVHGESFVDEQWGTAVLHLRGAGLAGDLRLPARFVDFNTLSVAIDAATIAQVGNVDVNGTARVEVLAASNGETYSTGELDVELSFRDKLAPVPATIQSSGVIFVNDNLVVEGDGFLLGGDEGLTVARLVGCFTLDTGGGCKPIAPIELPLVPQEPLSRTKAAFAFSPKVAGIKPGSFTGTVAIINKQTDQAPLAAPARDVAYDMVTPQIFSLDPPAASLGQYVFVRGGGFVGGEAGAITEVEVTGMFRRNGGSPVPVTLTLIPEFVEGRLVRYIINTDDALGQALDLRADTGSFTGTATPIITYGVDRVRGVSTAASFAIAPVKQVVHLQFQPTYVEGLRDFGLRAVDAKIRERIALVCKRAYAGVNIEFRTEAPDDFALYEQVELVGVDPNGTGLFGYDNSPGKDNGNLRLYDRLGGVNAVTQSDGYPGYGGVFLRSLMGFSKHPGSFAASVPGADALFDQIFDVFRADRGGKPVLAEDLGGGGGGVATLVDGSGCPAKDRKGQIACAVYVLGNLVGGTLAHEIGHSLGLANPFAEGFHNPGDAPNRLMDAGGDRPFAERAELGGQGPAVFCDDEMTYLRMILPTGQPAPAVQRPGCY